MSGSRNELDELQELLRHKAGQVPPVREAPVALSGRVRRRIALNALGAGLVAVVLVGGAFAGVRAFGTGTSTPGGSSLPTGSATAPPSDTAACTSAQLGASATAEGAAGSRLGLIALTNVSEATCTLQGTPAITLLNQDENPITSGVTFGSSPAEWVANASPEPPGWPVVTLAPGELARVRVRWSNWCLSGAAPQWVLDIPGGGSIGVDGLDAVGVPPCNGPGQPSTIDVGPFEPASGLG